MDNLSREKRVLVAVGLWVVLMCLILACISVNRNDWLRVEEYLLGGLALVLLGIWLYRRIPS